MLDTSDKNFMARKLLHESTYGILSTFSLEIAGYPFGSLTPYSLDRNGKVIILISDLAQHTKNIKANNHVSLTVVEKHEGNVQAFGRLTYIGDTQCIEETEYTDISKRHIRYFPEAKNSLQAHDFNFYRIHLNRARYIGGFGKIFWIEPEELLTKNPFDYEQELSILDIVNMNNKQSLIKYFNMKNEINLSDKNEVKIIGIDGQGLDILANTKKYRYYFSNIIKNTDDVINNLQELAKIDVNSIN